MTCKKNKNIPNFLFNSTDLTLTNDRNNDSIIVFKFRYALNTRAINKFRAGRGNRDVADHRSLLFSRGQRERSLSPR